MHNDDSPHLANLWLKTSLKTHNFIPEEYWIDNKALMAKKHLPLSAVYVAEKTGSICVFVALNKNHIESLFCSP